MVFLFLEPRKKPLFSHNGVTGQRYAKDFFQVNVDKVAESMMRHSESGADNIFNFENLVFKVVNSTNISQRPSFQSPGASITVGVGANHSSSGNVGVSFTAFPNLQCILNNLPEW